MRVKIVSLISVMLLIAAPLVFSQSKETGAIEGSVTDEEGSPLPGVTVTVSSPSLMGTRSMVTDMEGKYRFPALPPGVYTVKAELPGFKTVIQENVRLTTTVRLSLDLTMVPATLEEEVTVVGKAPTIDVKSTETASVTLSKEVLKNVPYSNFAMDIVNLAPGVVDDTAYGASSGTGVAYQVDGVDVSDTGGGTAWVFVDPYIVEEAKVMGVGLPAEYGNFTGVIFNLVTRTGGNEFSGDLQFIMQGSGKTELNEEGVPVFESNFWQADNTGAYIEDFPGLTPSGLELYDASAHLGGPIKKDKIWFFLGGQYYRTMTKVTGFPEDVDYKQPRAFVKLTFQLTPRTNVNAFFENDVYNGINRGAGSWVSPEATVNQESPDYVGNVTLTHILNQTTFFDLKAAFFTGYYYLDPEVGKDVSAHYSLNDNMRYDSAGYYYYADRERFQANASLTHYAEDFIAGDHDFKFGVEFERGESRDRYGYTGPNHMYYVDYVGWGYTGPYLAYQNEGYDLNPTYTRLEEFAQDSWRVSDRLNLSLGVRLTHVWGFVKGIDEAVYDNFRIAPRIGFTFDLFGDNTTVLKAHYGQFTEAMLAWYHDRLHPASAYSDEVGYYWDLGSQQWVEWYRITHEELYTMDPDVKHPYMDQFTVSLERELFTDTSLSTTFIYRNWKNIIGVVDTAAIWEPVDIYVPDLNKTYTIYQQINPGEHSFIITNLKEGDDRIPYVDVNPYRQYWGLQFTLNKRFSNGWQLLASYIYSEATGTLDNGGSDDIGWGGDTESPNFWINADGHSTNDPTHQLKIQGTVVLPFGINLSTYFQAITGDAWTTRYRTGRLAHGRVTFFCEPRGSNHYPISKILDLRVEKTFTFAEKYQVGLMFDVFNVLNDDTIRSWGTRIGYDWLPGEWPSTEGHELYRIVRPRQARLGIRFTF